MTICTCIVTSKILENHPKQAIQTAMNTMYVQTPVATPSLSAKPEQGMHQIVVQAQPITVLENHHQTWFPIYAGDDVSGIALFGQCINKQPLFAYTKTDLARFFKLLVKIIQLMPNTQCSSLDYLLGFNTQAWSTTDIQIWCQYVCNCPPETGRCSSVFWISSFMYLYIMQFA